MAENRVCDLGLYAGVIIPPSWIIKLPRKGSFKSSLKNSPKRCASAESARSGNAASARKAYMEHVPSSSLHHHHHHHHHHHSARHSVDREQQQQPTFILKPIPVANCSPVIVFLNPRSGGNQARNS
jgi:diacylglycerol kinase (ATP)